MAAPHTTFYLPDGQTSDGRETWTLVQNPNATAVTVEITYMTPNGAGNVTCTETIPANSRRTFNMAEHSGISGRAAIMVACTTAGKKIMVRAGHVLERPGRRHRHHRGLLGLTVALRSQRQEEKGPAPAGPFSMFVMLHWI